MKRILMVALCIFLSAGICFAGGQSEGDDAKKDKEFVVIKSSSIGGSWYACGAAFAKLISDKTDYIAMNSASPGLTNESIKRMAEGKAQLAIGDSIAGYPALMGEDSWDSPQNIRILFGLWPGVYNIIVGADSGINTLADLKGKSIATYVEGEPTGISFMELLEMAGVTPDNSKIYRIMKNDATRMFIDGQADCLIYAFGYGHAKLKEISTARKIKFLETPADLEKKFMEKYPYYIPANFGEEFGVPNAKQFISPYFVMCMDTLPEEQAYEFTKVWWENWDFLSEVMPSNIPHVNKENPKAGIPIPMHPGAERYFKEVGIIK